MMLARLSDWVSGRQKFKTVLLEMLAVFVGITASLFVDDWRETQQDHAILDQLIRETHYNALQSRAVFKSVLQQASGAGASARLLHSADLAQVQDRELIEHYARALEIGWVYQQQPGFERLRNTALSIPFSHTMAELDDLFSQLNAWGDDYNDIRASIIELGSAIDRRVEVQLDPSRLSHALANRSAEMMTELNAAYASNPDPESLHQEAESIRSWAGSREGAAAIRELVRLRFGVSVNLVYMIDRNESVIASIRLYDPNITLPFESIGLAGSATGFGWDVSIPMQPDRDDPNLWRVTVALLDGQLKFRADDNWSTNWGASGSVDSNLSFEFVGDKSAVFPTGVGEFQGLNIPVEGGQYEVTFDTQSFEYAFTRIDAGSP